MALPDIFDGICILAAICVGPAGGIGYLGVALNMAMILTLTSAVLWQRDYGLNLIDDTRQKAKAAKLAVKRSE